MKYNRLMAGVFSFLLVELVFFGLSANVALADSVRQQTVSVHKGWNAIYLHVTPTNTQPGSVFSGTPVSIVAANFGLTTSVQYVQNPGSISWKKDGWSVWYGPGRSDAFLSNLFALQGNKAYLVFAEQDFNLTITGTVTLQTILWQPNSFNLQGFGVDGASPPTFDKFFSGSSAHRPCKIYRLVNDQWTLVANPVTTAMKSGEAFWIYCNGGSDYQGPLAVGLTAGQTLTFGDTAETPVVFVNKTSNPQAITVDTVNPTGSTLPLAYVLRGITTGNIGDATFDFPTHYAPPTLEAGQTSSLWFKLRREKMTQPEQSALLKISSDTGAEVWVPITGKRAAITNP